MNCWNSSDSVIKPCNLDTMLEAYPTPTASGERGRDSPVVLNNEAAVGLPDDEAAPFCPGDA